MLTKASVNPGLISRQPSQPSLLNTESLQQTNYVKGHFAVEHRFITTIPTLTNTPAEEYHPAGRGFPIHHLIYKWRFVIVALLTVLPLFLINKTPHTSKADQHYIYEFLQQWRLKATPEQIHQNEQSELAFISKIQDSVIATIH